MTRDAVTAFQTRHALTADGVVGNATRALLDLPQKAVLQPEVVIQSLPTQVFTPEQLHRVAELIDALIPTGPFDLFDDAAIEWAVVKFDQALASLLPPHVLTFLHDSAQGFSGGDSKSLAARITRSLNNRFDIPLLSEESEEAVIGFFVDVVIEALQIGRTFDMALEKVRLRRL